MKILIDFLNIFGLHIQINPETSPFILFCIIILTLTLIALILPCCINIFIYYITIYITEKPTILNYVNKYKIIFKIFNFYAPGAALRLRLRQKN